MQHRHFVVRNSPLLAAETTPGGEGNRRAALDRGQRCRVSGAGPSFSGGRGTVVSLFSCYWLPASAVCQVLVKKVR